MSSPDLKITPNVQGQALGQADFEDLYHKYYDRIYRYFCYRLGSTEEGEDLVQTYFFVLHQELERGVKIRLSVDGWIFAKARHLLGKHRKKMNRFIPTDDLSYLAAPTETWRQLWNNELSGIILQAMTELPAREYSAFYLKMIEKKSTEAIAGILDISDRHCRRILDKACKRMANRLEKQGIGRPAVLEDN